MDEADDNNKTGYVTEEHILVDALGDRPKIRLLAVFVGCPDVEFNVTQLADYADLNRSTVSKYLDDMCAWGFVEEVRGIGSSRMFQTNTESNAMRELQQFEWELVKRVAELE